MTFACIAVVPLWFAQATPETVIHQTFAQEVRTSYTFGQAIPDRTPYGEKLSDIRAIAVTPDGRVVASVLSSAGNVELLAFDGESWSFLEPFIDHVTDTRQHRYVSASSGKTSYEDHGTIVAAALFPEKGDLIATEQGVWDRRDEDRLIFKPEDPVLAGYRGYGFRGVVTKPYELEKLKSEISRVLAEKKSQVDGKRRTNPQ